MNIRTNYVLRAIFLLIMGISGLQAQHEAPEELEDIVHRALSFYPDLQNTHITFKFKKHIRKSTMQAQPAFLSLFGSRKKRRYKILISERFHISGKEFETRDIPPDILVGWFGHELGHIADYKQRSSLNLFFFGLAYLLSDRHIRTTERTADAVAVSRGMESYILKTKEFLLNHSPINPGYRQRILKYYLSPEEIMALVDEREAE